MINKMNLAIPQPCHENWDNMTPAEKGRFCGTCQTQVVDFSTMTDLELVQFFKKPTTGSVCGRFMTAQLHRDIEIPKKRTPWLRYFFQFALPALFISKATAQAKTGKEVLNNTDTTKMKVTNDNRILGLVLPTIFSGRADTAIIETPVTKSRVIKGRVTDEKGTAIAFASITETANGNVIMTNEKGEFLLTIKNSLGNLLVAAAGYDTKKISLAETGDETTIQLGANPQEGTVETSGAGTYIKKENNGDLGSRGGITPPPQVETDEIVSRDIEVPVEKNRFYIYPNPIKSGGSITLGVHLLEEGYYTVRFTNAAGQAVQQKEIWIDANAKVLNLLAPSVTGGTYFISIESKKTGKKYTDKIVIQ